MQGAVLGFIEVDGEGIPRALSLKYLRLSNFDLLLILFDTVTIRLLLRFTNKILPISSHLTSILVNKNRFLLTLLYLILPQNSPRKAKIANFHITVLVNQEVRGLDVSVEKIYSMEEGEGA